MGRIGEIRNLPGMVVEEQDKQVNAVRNGQGHSQRCAATKASLSAGQAAPRSSRARRKGNSRQGGMSRSGNPDCETNTLGLNKGYKEAHGEI